MITSTSANLGKNRTQKYSLPQWIEVDEHRKYLIVGREVETLDIYKPIREGNEPAGEHFPKVPDLQLAVNVIA